MSKDRRIITAGGEPTKEVTPPVIVTAAGEPVVHEDAVTQVPKSVANEIISGDVDPDATDKGGTHTLTGNHIMGDGDRVEDNPSKETPTQTVTDHIITGETEGTPTRDDPLTQVTDEVITGGVDPDATDSGALQAPTLPVKVTSGELGPSAAYSAKNWGGDLIWVTYDTRTSSAYNGFNGHGEQAGDLLTLNCQYDNSDFNATPTFNSETNLTRLFASYNNNPAVYDWAYFFGMWKLTAPLTDLKDLEVTLGPSAFHETAAVVIRNFSEYY